MSIDRREFVILSAAVVAGCKSGNGGSAVNSGTSAVHSATGEKSVDAGPAENYAGDGVYNHFRSKGFFIVRSGVKLFALSSVCTHRACLLNVAPDHSFYCKCHGSTFDADGKPTKGPAKRDLPVLPISTDEKGHLQIRVPIA